MKPVLAPLSIVACPLFSMLASMRKARSCGDVSPLVNETKIATAKAANCCSFMMEVYVMILVYKSRCS